jgi:cation diffusion facilitator family transporter
MVVVIGVQVVLFIIQALAAWSTGSVAIAASTLHVAIDGAVHLVALGGIWVATRPADPSHAYGYERYESLASLLIGMLLLVAVALIMSEAVPRLLDPEPNSSTGLGLLVMAVAAAANALLAVFLGRRGRHLRSQVLRSEGTHAWADSVTALAVLVAVGLAALGLPLVDPLMGLVVAGIVAWRGWGIVRTSADVLSDATAVDVDAVRSAALAVPGVRDCHMVRSRGETGHVRVDLHIHVAPDMTVGDAHTIAREVERRVRASDDGVSEVLVHVGPYRDGGGS